jgi:hypothetical protein
MTTSLRFAGDARSVMPRALKAFLPALILFILLATPAKANEPTQVLAQITELCYGARTQPPADYAWNELKNDPTLAPFYFKAINSTDVGIDVKMALAEALTHSDHPTLTDLTLKSFAALEKSNPSTAMVLVRYASQKPHDDFAPWLAATMLRSYGGILPKDPDIYAPAMEALAKYPAPVIQNALRQGISHFGFDSVITSLSIMEMAEVPKDVMGSMATNLSLKKEFDDDAEKIINSVIEKSSAILPMLLTANASVHAVVQIMRALKLLLVGKLLAGDQKQVQAALQASGRFPILSDQLIETIGEMAKGRSESASNASDLLREWETNTPPAIDISNFKLQRVAKELSPDPGPEGTFEFQIGNSEQEQIEDLQSEDAFPWIFLIFVTVISAFIIRRIFVFARIRLARRKIKIFPLLFLLPAPIIIFFFWKIFIESDPVVRDVVNIRQSIRFISPLMLFSRQTLSNRILLVTRGTDTLRHEEVPVIKPDGEIRIVGIGESPLVASFFPREDGFLDMAVKAVAAGDPGRRYRSINAAAAGYCMFDHVFRIEDILRLKPDIVVIYTINPLELRIKELIENSDLANLQIKFPFSHETQKQLDNHIRELESLSDEVAAGKLSSGTRQQELISYADRLFAFSAKTFIRYLMENDIQILVIIPATPAPRPVISRMNETMRQISAQEGLVLVDASESVKNEIQKTGNWRQFFWDQTHPARKGHALIAKELAPAIAKSVQSIRQ